MNALFKLFIKNSDDTSDPAVRNAYGNFTGFFGIISNFILFAVKVVLGVVTSSISVTADAINNLCDAGSSIITVFGFKIAGKPVEPLTAWNLQQAIPINLLGGKILFLDTKLPQMRCHGTNIMINGHGIIV